MNRISTVIKQKANVLVDKYEDPREALDYSYTKQIELLNKLRRDIAEVVTAKRRLEMQKAKLWDNIRTLDEQARRSLDADREDLAKLALERKNANLLQLQGLAPRPPSKPFRSIARRCATSRRAADRSAISTVGGQLPLRGGPL
jgi:phage shock protein A